MASRLQENNLTVLFGDPFTESWNANSQHDEICRASLKICRARLAHVADFAKSPWGGGAKEAVPRPARSPARIRSRRTNGWPVSWAESFWLFEHEYSAQCEKPMLVQP